MKRHIISGEPTEKQALPTGRKVVAAIGIDQYRSWPKLHNAVSDARGARDMFLRLGFEEITPPLLDDTATGDAIRRLVTDDLSKLSLADSLVLFFAGHGHTQVTAFENSQPVKTGYIVPVDGDRPGGIVATWLRIDSWLSDVARLRARHILVILDACYSGVALGSLLHWRGAGGSSSASLESLQRRRSRRVITSALDDQRAMDSGPLPGHSLFTGCLIEGLTWGLTQHGRAITTGSEIGRYIQERVTTYPSSVQTPDFGALELDDRGELVIQLSDIPGPPPPLPGSDATPPVPVDENHLGKTAPNISDSQNSNQTSTPSAQHDSGGDLWIKHRATTQAGPRILLLSVLLSIILGYAVYIVVQVFHNKATPQDRQATSESPIDASVSPSDVSSPPNALTTPVANASPTMTAVIDTEPKHEIPGTTSFDDMAASSPLHSRDLGSSNTPRDPATKMLKQAEAALQKNQLDQAIAIATKALKAGAPHQDSYRILAMTYCQQHAVTAAKGMYEKLTKDKKYVFNYCQRRGVKL